MTLWSISHFALLGLAAAYAAGMAAFGRPFAFRTGLIDDPSGNARKLHRTPTPLLGGLCVLPATILGLFWIALTGDAGRIGHVGMASIAVAVLISMIVGMWDDRTPLPALPRLAICGGVFLWVLLLAPLLIVSILNFQLFAFVTELGWLAIPFTALCLLALQNAINLADGKNGLVIGLSLIWTTTLLMVTLRPETPHPGALALTLAAISLAVVLPFNLKGKLFLGDSGTYGLGAFLGLMTIWLHRSELELRTLDVVVMYLVPVVDMLRLFVIRIRSGRSPFAGDRSHLHHYLVDGVGLRNGLCIYYSLVALPILVNAAHIIHPLATIVVALSAYAAVAWLAYRRREQEAARNGAQLAI